MDVSAAIKARFSVRAYKNDTIAENTIRAIIELARYAPSGVNTQPWRVDVLTGLALARVSEALLKQRAENIPPNPDYNYYPTQWFEPYKKRRTACGAALYGALAIDYGDKTQRLEQWNKNYRFFGAPVGLIISLDKALAKGSWLDVGFFIENIMLLACEHDLGTCPQASIAEYPDTIRQELGIAENNAIVCGIALGKPDSRDPVNQYRTGREAVDTFTQWHKT